MEWRDQGILLGTRAHGETSVIIDTFTPSLGRHLGIVRGGTSRKMAPALQIGAQLDLSWRARLEDHLGTFTVEPIKNRAGLIMDDRLLLAGMQSVAALLIFALPEREAHPNLYAATLALLDLLTHAEVWPHAYLRWEMSLLAELGFALDLSTCAVTGQTMDLIYVSPKTGRAVSRAGAGEWADRLLPLTPAMTTADATLGDVQDGLRTTGHFLTHHLGPSLGNKDIPTARARFCDLIARLTSAAV